METTKPYTGPEIFRVELDHQQAILSACSLRALHPMQMGDGYGSQLVSDDSLQERQQHGRSPLIREPPQQRTILCQPQHQLWRLISHTAPHRSRFVEKVRR